MSKLTFLNYVEKNRVYAEGFRKHINPYAAFFLLLMRLAHNYTFDALSSFFNIDDQTAANIYYSLIVQLAKNTSNIPSIIGKHIKDVISHHMIGLSSLIDLSLTLELVLSKNNFHA